MKKKFLSIVSLLVALVMSLTLAACHGGVPSPGNPDNPDNPDNPPSAASGLTVGKVVGAMEELVDLENGYKATVSFNASTKKNGDGTKGGGSFEKRGSKFKTVVSENGTDVDVIVDIASGFVYNGVDGKYAVDAQAVPAGLAEYVKNAFAANGSDENAAIADEDGVAFDEATKTLTVDVDLKDEVNAVLTPLIDAYKNNSSAKKLVNDYIALYDEALDIDSLLDTGIELLVGIKDTTIGALLTQANVSLEDILAQAGAELDAQTLAVIKNRKVGDAIMGALEFIEANMQDIAAGNFDPAELMQAVLVAPVDNSGLKNKLTQYKDMLLQMLDGYKMKDLIDMLADDVEGMGLINNPLFAGVYCMLTEEIKATKLAAQLTVTFDDDYRITKLAGKADFAHTYTGTEITTGLFADNDYHADFELVVSEYKEAVEAWTMEYVADQDDIENIVVMADGSADCAVYCEFYGRDVEVKIVGVTATCADNVSVLSTDGVTFDAAKSQIVVKKSVFDAAKAKSGFTGVMGVGAIVTVKDGDQTRKFTMRLSISGVSDDPAGYLQEMIVKIIDDVINRPTTPPDVNEG